MNSTQGNENQVLTQEVFKPEKIILYDTSALINVGAKAGGVQASKFWASSGIPTGGLFRFFATLLKDLKTEDMGKTAIIACCDSPKSYRKEMFSGYKGNRNVLQKAGLTSEVADKIPLQDLELNTWRSLNPTHKENIALKMSVIIQINILKEILNDIGVTVFEADGLEADDIIYSVVNAYPDTPIIIKADDQDLVDCKLLNKQVTFRGCTTKSNINNVTPGELVHKYLSGCASDCIPSISHIPEALTIKNAMLEGLLNPYEVKVGINMNIEPILKFGIPKGYAEMIARNIYLVFPFICSVNLVQESIDMNKLYYWFSVLGFQKFSKNLFEKEIDKSPIEVNNKISEFKSRIPSYLSEYLYQGNNKVSFSK